MVTNAIKGLDDPLRTKIIEEFINHGKMSYSDLKKRTGIDNNGSLNYHLNILSEAALIERFEKFQDVTESNDRSFYDVSQLGKRLINGLLSGLDYADNLTHNYFKSSSGSETKHDNLEKYSSFLKYLTLTYKANIQSSLEEIALDKTKYQTLSSPYGEKEIVVLASTS